MLSSPSMDTPLESPRAAPVSAATAATPAAAHATVTDLERGGDLLLAYEAAQAALQRWPDDVWLRHRVVLLLARSGALRTALERFLDLGLAEEGDEDAAALGARLLKDVALLPGAEPHRVLAAAEAYARVHRRTGGTFSGINAATLLFLAGRVGEGRDLAEAVLQDLEAARADAGLAGYYWHATRAEALVLLGQREAAQAELARAAACSDDPGARATTLRQLRRLAARPAAAAVDLSVLATGGVCHFAGHMIDTDPEDRFPPAGEAQAADAIAAVLADEGVVEGYGSLAGGADILFAEALLARGGRLHVVLPFDRESFLDASVRPGGPGWEARFHACLERAASVLQARRGPGVGEELDYAQASTLAMGRAILRAEILAAPVVQLALYDGAAAGGPAGTAADVRRWAVLGLRSRRIGAGLRGAAEADLRPGPSECAPSCDPGRAHEGARRPVAVLFGDFAGFSRLQEGQIEAFVRRTLGTCREVLNMAGPELLEANTWGDGLFLVFASASAAACTGLALQRALRAGGPDGEGHPALRLGGHAALVQRLSDPVTGRTTAFGSEVALAARIEPVAPPNALYVTEAFAATLALEGGGGIACDYVGLLPTAKGFGHYPMYRARSLAEPEHDLDRLAAEIERACAGWPS
jgi:hypothetical protein